MEGMEMNTREHETMKMRGSSDISYLGQAVDSMIYDFMREHEIPRAYACHCTGAVYPTGGWIRNV